MSLLRPRRKQEELPARRRRADVSSSDLDNDDRRFVTGRSMTYRRNRTLTGSSSPHIASTNELDAELKSPRAHVHHLSKMRNKILRRLVIVMVALVGIYGLMSQFTASVALSNASQVPEQAGAYITAINAYYSGHPVERLRPALNEEALLRFVQAEHPEVVSLSLEHSAEIGKGIATLKLRKPVARWVINNQTEFVDQNGVVFSYTPYPKPGIQIVDNNAVTSAASGINLVASHRFLSFVGQIVGEAEEKGYVIKKVTVPLLTTRQLEVSIKGVHYSFKLTIDRSAGEQVEDISRIVTYLRRKGIHPQYVDVRIPGKAFYR